MTQNELILSGVHMDLTPALKNIVEEKADKLFRHESEILRIRFELQYNANHSHDKEFEARGTIEINGPDMCVSVQSNDLYKSIDLLVEKLDRKLRRRSRLKRSKRKHAKDVDIPAQLPKISAA